MDNIDYGHWSVLEEVDIKKYLAFTYVITFKNGKKYIGVKKIWKKIKRTPSEFKRPPKEGFHESDWKTYTSSSNAVNDMILDGVEIDSMVIVGWYTSWGKALLAEMEMQLASDVLRDDTWLNGQIGGHFNPNCFDDLTESDISRWVEFNKGNEHVNWPVMYKVGCRTKYVNPQDVDEYLNKGWQYGRSKTEKIGVITKVLKYTLWDYTTDVPVVVSNQNKFAREHNIPPSHLSRLVAGEIDFLQDGKYGLPPGLARVRHPLSDPITGCKYASNSEAESHFGLKRGGALKLIKTGVLIKNKVETRSDYIKRLKGTKFVESVHTVSTPKLITNSVRDFFRDMSQDEVDHFKKWIPMYVEYLEGTTNA